MPPWVAPVPRSTRLPTGRTIERFSLSLRRYNASIATPQNVRVRCAPKPYSATPGRYASTLVSPTAINLRPNIPPSNAELYNALSELSGKAEQYVNISRLQLALRGLAASDGNGVTRIAILSLNSQLSAQKLARLLLADPLGDKGRWERVLENDDIGEAEGRAVLIRHGDETDAHPPSPLYDILAIPSRILRAHNIEILVSTLNVNTSNTPITSTLESSKDAVLVPKLQATSARGLPVPYPVHKTLILGDGLDSAVEYGRFTADSVGEMGDMVKVAVDLPAPMKDVEADGHTCSAINVDLGTEALASFRESIANSAKYERGWFRSGIPAISGWLLHGLQSPEPTKIKPTMKAFISSIADDVEANVTKEDMLQLNKKLASSAITQQTSESILRHLENWAEQSHTELRDQLDLAFSSRNWQKLAWWKLFWRVDDVTMISSEILERRWLVDAEKGGVYLAGRMNQAGFPDTVEHLPEPSEYTEVEQRPVQGPLPSPPLATQQEQATVKMDLSTEVFAPQPWPSQIPTTRSFLAASTIPPLQSLAQRLVLTTLSTTSLSSAISALLYISTPASLFEASAIAALGLVWSLRRMQNLWETTRRMWEEEVREEGRKTLKGTEEEVRWIVKGWENRSAKDKNTDDNVAERRAAREAVGRVRNVLEKM